MGTITHTFVSPVADAGNPNEVSPNDWNAAHTIVGPLDVTAQTRNRIVNGAMQHSQENGNTASGTNGYYVADQWASGFFGFTVSAQRASGVPTSTGLRISTGVITGKAPAATDFLYLYQPIEGTRIADFLWGTASALPVMLRFWAYSTIAGTFTVSIRNNATDRSYLAGFTVTANTWTLITLAIPGDTTGTWLTDTGTGLTLGFCYSCGTTYQGAAGWQTGNKIALSTATNGGATTNNTLAIGDVGLYLDPMATGVAPRFEMPDYAQEQAACQRYWYRAGSPDAGTAHYGAAGQAFANMGVVPFPVTLRTGPAASISTAPSYSNCSAMTIIADTTAGAVYVTVGGIGSYSTNGAVFTFNARM